MTGDPAGGKDFLPWFRNAAPYINAHRGRTFVIVFEGEAVAAPGFDTLVHDLALLHSLGVRLVLVHGARPQIEARLTQRGLQTQAQNGLRITTREALPAVIEGAAAAQAHAEGQLSMGLPNSPMAGARIRVASGNFVTARPLGVRDGVDFQHTGEVRRVETEGMRPWLERDGIVLLGPVAFSPTGEAFNLSAHQVALATATALRADKLLVLSEAPLPRHRDGSLIRELSLDEARRLLAENPPDQAGSRELRLALDACRRGVRRTHLLYRPDDGALIQELFSRDGFGTMVTDDYYDDLRPAGIEDVGGILELIMPLERAGVLVRRSRELLETEIGRFLVMERDGMVIGCGALYPVAGQEVGEIACVSIHPDYQRQGRAVTLLRRLEREARRLRLHTLFVLTTRASHWFLEQGFRQGRIEELPVAKRATYNFQRNSKVFFKVI